MHHGLIAITVALWTSALSFTIAGTQSHLLETRLMLFAWGLLLGVAGAGLGSCLYIARALEKEADRSTRAIASAVGEAVGTVFEKNEVPVDEM